MPIAVDASTPAYAENNDGVATCASFTAPALALLTVQVTTIEPTGTTVTDSVDGATGWTKAIEVATSSAQIWWKIVSTAVARTVTADDGQSGFGGYIGSKVQVWTGAHATAPIGLTGSGTTTTNNATVNAYTSSADGSWGICTALDAGVLGLPTSTDTVLAADAGVNHSHLSVRKATATATSGTAVTFNLDAAGASAPAWHWAALEILPAAGAAATSPARFRRALRLLYR